MWPESLDLRAESSGDDSNTNHAEMEDLGASRSELELLQAFIDGVGIWMDSLDERLDFKQVIPFYALKSPLIFNALLACGAKHLSSKRPELEDRAATLYNSATAQLVRTLENPEREIADCAAASILLNVYEALCHIPIWQMSHMLGARALVIECGWNASSTGIPAACFWLSMGIEVQYCLAMHCPTAENPDDWGLGCDWSRSDGSTGVQTWVHRSFYALAKVTNFRATESSNMLRTPVTEQSTLSLRLAEWQALKRLCDDWSRHCPQAMRPAGCAVLGSKEGLSCLPQFWSVSHPAEMGLSSSVMSANRLQVRHSRAQHLAAYSTTQHNAFLPKFIRSRLADRRRK